MPRINTAPPEPPPKEPTGLWRLITTPGVRRRAEGKSPAFMSSICCSLITVTSLARRLTWSPSMMGEDTTTTSPVFWALAACFSCSSAQADPAARLNPAHRAPTTQNLAILPTISSPPRVTSAPSSWSALIAWYKKTRKQPGSARSPCLLAGNSWLFYFSPNRCAFKRKLS